MLLMEMDAAQLVKRKQHGHAPELPQCATSAEMELLKEANNAIKDQKMLLMEMDAAQLVKWKILAQICVETGSRQGKSCVMMGTF